MCVQIKDSGCGIPCDKILSIFDEMNTDQENRNWDGIGLGLPICLKLAIQNNCFIKYGSVLNEQTIFRL